MRYTVIFVVPQLGIFIKQLDNRPYYNPTWLKKRWMTLEGWLFLFFWPNLLYYTPYPPTPQIKNDPCTHVHMLAPHFLSKTACRLGKLRIEC